MSKGAENWADHQDRGQPNILSAMVYPITVFDVVGIANLEYTRYPIRQVVLATCWGLRREGNALKGLGSQGLGLTDRAMWRFKAGVECGMVGL